MPKVDSARGKSFPSFGQSVVRVLAPFAEAIDADAVVSAAVVPGRPVKYVKDHVKREYDPLARKGPWKPEEDEALRRSACRLSIRSKADIRCRAQQTHPNQWAKISQIVERPELDCRCRWRDELQHQDTKVEGECTPTSPVHMANS